MEKASILNKQKSDSMHYDFLINEGSQNLNQHFLNNFVGIPSVPIIGKYQRNVYEFNDLKGLVAVQCFFDKNDNVYRTEESISVNLPQSVQQILQNLPEMVPHNKPKQRENNKNNNNNNKNYIPDFHPLQFKIPGPINFLWSISFQNPLIERGEKQHYKNKLQEPYHNLVLHTFIFQEINFSKSKKQIHYIPACIVIPDEIQKYCGVIEWTRDDKNVNFGSIRSEYISCHLKGQSLCFSPNNMKFEILDGSLLQNFYSIVLCEDQFHHVTLHWNFTDIENFQTIEQIMKASKNLQELIGGFEIILGDKNEALQHVKKVFNF